MSITFAVGNGDCAPFVGHNAFLRWKAVQSVAYEEDGELKFWSDGKSLVNSLPDTRLTLF